MGATVWYMLRLPDGQWRRLPSTHRSEFEDGQCAILQDREGRVLLAELWVEVRGHERLGVRNALFLKYEVGVTGYLDADRYRGVRQIEAALALSKGRSASAEREWEQHLKRYRWQPSAADLQRLKEALVAPLHGSTSQRNAL